MKKLIFAFLALIFAYQVQAQTALKVGDVAPDFSAKDSEGKSISLKQLLKKNKSVVVFFYRGQWCPYCNKQISQLQDSLSMLTEKGAFVVGITPETNESIVATRGKTKASFPIVSDHNYTIMKNYHVNFNMDAGLIDKYKKYGIDVAKNNGSTDSVLPVPATYIIGKNGKIKFAYFDTDYKKRATVASMLKVL